MKIELIDLVRKLIRVSSVTDSKNESDPVFLIKKILERTLPQPQIQILGRGTKKNIIVQVGLALPSILFNSHFDVVPGKKAQFRPRLIGDRLWGRGSCDAKSSLAAMICAFIELSKLIPEQKLILACVCDEENAGEYGSQVVKNNGIVGDYNIFGEPTDLVPIITEKGFLRLKIISHGKSAHAAYPEKGVNAIDKLFLAVDLIRKIIDVPANPLLGKPTLNFSQVSGGQKINVVPDLAVGQVDIRLLPEQHVQEVLKSIKKELKREGKYSLEVVAVGQSFSSNVSSPLVQSAIKHCHRKPQGIAFATDARFFNSKDCLVLGPGNPQLSHQDNESILVSELNQAVTIYKNIVLDLLKPL